MFLRVTSVEPASDSIRSSFVHTLHKYTTSELYDLMMKFESGKSEASIIIYDIVEYIITARKEKPCSLHYAALIRANASAYWGSASCVRELLLEMDELGIPKDSIVYHNALLVLSIHPDYVLRMEILSEMKKLWFTLNTQGWHHLITGLVRDRQYEVAVEKLEHMLENEIPVEPWLFDILMYQLCESEEYEEVLAILKYRWDHGRNKLHSEVWHFLMDLFARDFFHEGLRFIWRYQVQTGYLIPSDGILSATLNTAARYADPQLAISAIGILSTRSAVEPYHYEALMEAYAKSEDLESAFRVLSIMVKAGQNPDATNTRSLFAYLSSNVDLPGLAWETLTKIHNHSNGQPIDIISINVVLESCICQMNVNLAMILYKKIRTISNGPNLATFNHILQGLSKTVIPSTKEAKYLISEMDFLGIKADELTYDRLILIFIREENYEAAFQYLEKMIKEGTGKNEGKGWWMRQGTAQKFAITCLTENDSRGFQIMAGMEKREMDVSKIKSWICENSPKKKK